MPNPLSKSEAFKKAEREFLEKQNCEWSDLHEYAQQDFLDGFDAGWEARGGESE